MKKIKNIVLLFILAGFISGCGVYDPIEIVPDHIQTTRINPIKNKTPQIMLTSDLTEEIINEIVKEGRLTVVSSPDADSSLDTTIIEYSKVPLSYDENFIVLEYQLSIIVNLKFNDHIKKVMLWKDVRDDSLTGGIEVWVKYYVGTDMEFAETEEEARERLVEDVAKDILHKIIYGWE